jgi:hypothetical protein
MSVGRITHHSVRIPLSYFEFSPLTMRSVGSEPLEDLAQRIWASVGPSGQNKACQASSSSEQIWDCFPQEYLYRLAESVRQLAPASYDSHLFALEVSRRTIITWIGDPLLMFCFGGTATRARQNGKWWSLVGYLSLNVTNMNETSFIYTPQIHRWNTAHIV